MYVWLLSIVCFFKFLVQLLCNDISCILWTLHQIQSIGPKTFFKTTSLVIRSSKKIINMLQVDIWHLKMAHTYLYIVSSFRKQCTPVQKYILSLKFQFIYSDIIFNPFHFFLNKNNKKQEKRYQVNLKKQFVFAKKTFHPGDHELQLQRCKSLQRHQ
jgi:hypothetical protein